MSSFSTPAGPMHVYVQGTEFRNKGAELMLRAIVEELGRWPDESTICSHLRMGTRHQRRMLGLNDLAAARGRKLDRIPFLGAVLDRSAALVPSSGRGLLKLVRRGEVNLVLDASGFGYSDQWGPSRTEFAARDYEDFRSRGAHVILLPQAFGPFSSRRIRRAMARVVDASTAVFPRDETSLAHLQGLGSTDACVALAPDFTCVLGGHVPCWADDYRGRPCVVPNMRMIDKVESDVAAWYANGTRAVLEVLRDEGLKPFILVHEVDDGPLAERLGEDTAVPVLREKDPLVLKGVLGGCSVVYAARYHALVSAMSQAVPSVGVGWSHKYRHLFADYGVTSCLISSEAGEDELVTLLRDLAVAGSIRTRVRERLTTEAARQRQLTNGMWRDVRTRLGLR